MSEETNIPYLSPFESIRRENDNGHEYWSARDLAKVLGYTEYGKFKNALAKAELACKNSGYAVSGHFAHVSDMISTGKGAKRQVENVHLSRYGCYLLVENADPSKEIVALGQTYFAAQTRRQELADQYAALPENQKRLMLRGEINSHNLKLASIAKQAGVVSGQDFAIFQDHGYQGLYGGLSAQDIHRQKGLSKNQHILDHMGSEELANNVFRAAQTEAKLHRENIQGKTAANQTHYAVGRKVRETIAELGGTMPENLPTPKESIPQLQKREEKRWARGPQLPLFEVEEAEK